MNKDTIKLHNTNFILAILLASHCPRVAGDPHCPGVMGDPG